MHENSKIPPHNLDAEKALLCCILTDEEALIKHGLRLDEKIFYSKANRLIYKAIAALNSDHVNVDMISLKNQLITMGKFNEIGSLPYLVEIINTVSTSANIKHYAEIVTESYKLRTIIQNSASSMEMAYSRTDANQIIGNLQNAIYSTYSDKHSEPVSVAEYFATYEIKQHEALKNQSCGIPTGFRSLDQEIGGLQPGNLIVIAARPSMGKSQLGIQFADNAAKRKEPTGIISLEMPHNDLLNRLISARTGICLKHLRDPKLQTREDLSKLGHYLPNIKESGKYLFFDYCPGINLADLVMKIRLMKLKYNVSTVFVDYLGLIRIDQKKDENTTDAIGRITSALKILAGELEIAIVLLAQLNRDLEKRPDKRPMMSDLRGSGNIEQDADLILFIYREHYYLKKEFNSDGKFILNTADIIIGKQRNGSTTTVELKFKADCVTFYEELTNEVPQLF